MNTDLFWPIACLAIGLILLVAEVFIPSGGLIGLLAVGFLAVSVYLAFSISTATGVKFLFAEMLLLPAALALAVHLWPRTPMAKWIFLKPPEPEDVAPESSGPRLSYLVGQYGRSLTPLRPSGMVVFDGRRIGGLAEDGLIPAGALVRAVSTRGGELVVRTVPEESIDQFLGPADPGRPDRTRPDAV